MSTGSNDNCSDNVDNIDEVEIYTVKKIIIGNTKNLHIIKCISIFAKKHIKNVNYDEILMNFDINDLEDREPKLQWGIDCGNHVIEYLDNIFHIYIYKSKDVKRIANHITNYIYTIEIKVKNTDPSNTIDTFIKDALKYYEKIEMTDNSLYILNNGEYWQKIKKLIPRESHTIHLDEGVFEDLIAKIKWFKNPKTKQQYRRIGRIYKLNILLYGIPGSGKTSVITRLATCFKMNIALCSIVNVTDDNLMIALNDDLIVKKSIVVFEDLDINCPKRSQSKNKLTLSGLLNVLDGPMAVDGCITIITVNNIKTLDPALIRSGRIDKIVKFDYATPYQIRSMFNLYFPDNEAILVQFLKKVKRMKLTTATLQTYFQLCENSDTVLKKIRDLETIIEKQQNFDDSPSFYT